MPRTNQRRDTHNVPLTVGPPGGTRLRQFKESLTASRYPADEEPIQRFGSDGPVRMTHRFAAPRR
ncbi:hypothetical protein NCCP436_29220 [Pseudomonas sp. NCCP-436]|nr:hypothetical protein NCCP436_29220 [Pseudomonas sp. NCCP-436]